MLAPIMRAALRVGVLLGAAMMLMSGCGEQKTSPAPQRPVQLKETETYSGDNAYVHCAAICALGPRPTGSDAYVQQVNYITEQLQRVGWQVQARQFYPQPGLSMCNVHAVYGEESDPRPLLISCHIDTKGRGSNAILGADDGASGAAAIIELARILARRPELAEKIELVFYDGEEALSEHITPEDGLYGSRFDVQRRGDVLPRWMINLDMVGGAGKTIGVPLWDTSERMYRDYVKAVRAQGLSEVRWTIYPGSYWDDHRPFLEAGVDTLNLIAQFQRSNWWHTVRDDMSRISPDSLLETGKLVLQLIEQLVAYL